MEHKIENAMECTMDYVWGEETFEVVEDCCCESESNKPKNIVISFDGTGGEPHWAVQCKDNCDKEIPLYENFTGLSNICKFHLIAGGNIGNTKKYFDDQISFYYEGVGTRGSALTKLLRQIPGFSNGYAMDYIARMACKQLHKIYREGDKLFVFGFSRGAAIARLFASHLDRYPNKKFEYKIHLLGVYDTVVQSIKYSVTERIADLDIWEKKDSNLPEVVQKAVHFVAIDEHRKNFAPTLFNADERVKEIWVPGCHSDVGGGYYHDGISDAVLKCMRIEAKEAGMKFREITEETCENKDHTLIAPKCGLDTDAFRNFDNDMKINANACCRDVHDERKGLSAFALVYRFLSWVARFEHRDIVTMRNDLPSDEPVLILDIAVKRARELELDIVPGYNSTYDSKKYRPEHLKGIRYRVVSSEDMSVSDEVYVLEKEVEW